MTRVDPTAYTRILNNLLQNTLTHSDARQVSLTITETEQQAKIIVADNGKGISAADLPHIFERMYQCDHSRSAKGNGSGRIDTSAQRYGGDQRRKSLSRYQPL